MHKKSSSAVLPETLYSPEAEQSVLGGLMLDNDRWDEVAPLLQAEDFCSRAHQEIWKKMAALCQINSPIDLITLSDVLEKDGVLERVGALLIWRNYPKTPQCGQYCPLCGDCRGSQPCPWSDDARESAGHPECGGSGKYTGVM